jgi:predicted dehydrogenase
VNILIVGLGSIAKKHIAALKAIVPKALIFALRSSTQAEVYKGVVNIYNINEIPAGIDFAIISTPSNLHFPFIELLAKKNIPLFIEKPPVHALTNVDKLTSLIDQTSLITYVACNLRFHPCLIYLKEMLRMGHHRINEINIYCGSYLPEWRTGKDFRATYSANSLRGGGVHLDLFHELDYTIWLFGLPNKSHSILRSVSSLDIDAVDFANYILEFNHFTANIILNYYRKQPRREIEIVFKDYVLVVDLIKNVIKSDSGSYSYNAVNYSPVDTYISQLEYFIRCLKEKSQPMNSLKESIEILKICLNNV